MKKFIAMLLAMVMILGLCACGTNGKTDKKVVVVGYTEYAPMNYTENGELIGFDTELAKLVFTNMGYDEVVFTEIEWSQKYTELESGAIDCIWNGFTCNAADDDGVQRSEKVDFSYRYMENQQVVVAKKGSGITDAASLNGMIGTAEIGSAGEGMAKDFEGTTYKGCTKQTDCLLEVSAGTADFAVLDVQLARSYVGQGNYADMEIIDALNGTLEYYAIGFKKGSDLTAKVNAELEKLAADGTIAKLGEKYGVSNSVITDFSDQK